ncbi:MAG TPA: hypothetical protein VJ654_04970 [Noviherbaspirillum sp.]|nr:hypothetical protein [Noviherbaspirillum sp.]
MQKPTSKHGDMLNPLNLFRRIAMNTLTITDLPVTEELNNDAMAAVQGGMMKLPFQRASTGDLLTSPDGEPVSVYVDGLLVNSVTTGYAPR